MGLTNSKDNIFHKINSPLTIQDQNLPLVPQPSLQTTYEPFSRSAIPQAFLESKQKIQELDMISSCHYFQKTGLKPVHTLPLHEVCFGIEEISAFVECFSNNITKMNNLKKLSMHWNILSYQDLENDFGKLRSRVEKLGNHLRKLKNLEHLVFKISRNQPKSLLSLFKSVVNNRHMKKLGFELQASKFQKEDIMRITGLLKGAANLTELSLSFKRCLLSDEAFAALFDCLYRLVNLKRLRLNFAFMTNMGEEQIQKTIRLLEKLPQLDCLFVNLSGTDIDDQHIKKMMESFAKSRIIKQCHVKVGSCRKISFMMASQANSLQGFVIAK